MSLEVYSDQQEHEFGKPVAIMESSERSWKVKAMGRLTQNKIFGTMFKYRRLAAGLTQQQLADICHCALSEISKIENGRKHAPHQVIERADKATGDDGELIAMYAELPWDDLKEGFQEYLRHEERATRIRDYQPLIIPGILQTAEYARSLIMGDSPDAKPETVDNMVSDRMDRQRIFERDDPPELAIVLDELTLRRRVGGPEVHSGQLDALIEAAQRPEVTVRVIPTTTLIRGGLSTGFTVLSLDAAPEIAYSEDPVIGRVTDDPERVGRYVSKFDAVRAYALPVEASLVLIRKVREES